MRLKQEHHSMNSSALGAGKLWDKASAVFNGCESVHKTSLALAIALFGFNAPTGAAAEAVGKTIAASNPANQICQLIEAAAQANALPMDFFARLIWQESRFRPEEVGPITRSGERAQGIAQFMPGTAAERQLTEPFNPVEALPKSGAFLAELRAEFGNLGLAAAAYNAGPQRVREFLAGARGLPTETRNYVHSITGRAVEDWATLAKGQLHSEHGDEPAANEAPIDCHDLVASLERVPRAFAAQWQGRNVPSWCRGLRHPNVGECGPVHLIRSGSTAPASAALPRSRVHLTRSASR
jgi:transglycosylase-like protein with SLT domain